MNEFHAYASRVYDWEHKLYAQEIAAVHQKDDETAAVIWEIRSVLIDEMIRIDKAEEARR